METYSQPRLRIEIVVHNTKELHCGRSLPKFSEIVLRLKEILNRFLNALRRLDLTSLSNDSLGQLAHTFPSRPHPRRGGERQSTQDTSRSRSHHQSGCRSPRFSMC